MRWRQAGDRALGAHRPCRRARLVQLELRELRRVEVAHRHVFRRPRIGGRASDAAMEPVWRKRLGLAGGHRHRRVGHLECGLHDARERRRRLWILRSIEGDGAVRCHRRSRRRAARDRIVRHEARRPRPIVPRQRQLDLGLPGEQEPDLHARARLQAVLRLQVQRVGGGHEDLVALLAAPHRDRHHPKAERHVPGDHRPHAVMHRRRDRITSIELELAAQSSDEPSLGDEPALDEDPAQSFAPLSLSSEGGLELPLVDEPKLNEQLPQTFLTIASGGPRCGHRAGE